MRQLFRTLFVLFAWMATADAQTAPAARAGAHHVYAPPRTPWGDPDLQGIYTNKYEQNTPFERPAEGPMAFLPFRDVFEIARGSRPWLVVDPPDGHIPPLRADARDRATPADADIYAVNERYPVGGSSGRGP